jgi:hypothetical protein
LSISTPPTCESVETLYATPAEYEKKPPALACGAEGSAKWEGSSRSPPECSRTVFLVVTVDFLE